MSKAYNIKQVAEKLKISVDSVRKLIKNEKLKAYKAGNKGYIINEISLSVFLGKKVEDCIDEKEFEKTYADWNKMYNGKIDKRRFFEYYCSIFLPGTNLTDDYFLIKEPTLPKSQLEPDIKETQSVAYEKEMSEQIMLTKADIIGVIESLDRIKNILQDKID